MGKPKGQKFTLADFTSMVGQKNEGESWADEEVDLPTAPTGASRATPSDEYRPGRGPSSSSDHGRPMAPLDLSRIPTTGPFTAYIGNLPYTITESSLRTGLFAGFTVTELRVPMEAGTGKARGFAYATFPTSQEMGRAMQAVHGKEFGGRVVRMDVSESSGPSSSAASAFGEWRSGAKVGGHVEDRPGRRPDPQSSRRYQREEIGDWRSATPSSSSTSSAFGASRGPTDDRPGRRPSAPRQSHSSRDFTITRDDFGKKI